jgi:hypothetical protein
MDSGQFDRFLSDEYVVYFWLGCFKYKVSQLYTLSPASEYNAEMLQRKTGEAGILNGKQCVSESEHKRLVTRYSTFRDDQMVLPPDIVVLTNDEFLQQVQPPDDTFRLSYQNSTFRVWVRQ